MFIIRICWHCKCFVQISNIAAFWVQLSADSYVMARKRSWWILWKLSISLIRQTTGLFDFYSRYSSSNCFRDQFTTSRKSPPRLACLQSAENQSVCPPFQTFLITNDRAPLFFFEEKQGGSERNLCTHRLQQLIIALGPPDVCESATQSRSVWRHNVGALLQQKEKGCVTGEMHGMLCIARVRQEKFRRTFERNNHRFAKNVCTK